MTREEINMFLANTKVYVNGKSKEIQEKLFSLGYEWCGGCTEVKYTKSPFLFIDADMSFSMSCNINIFSSHKNREISAEEILSLEITEPEYKFDPKTLKPFDKVLVRNKNDFWKCGLFSNINSDACEYKYNCIGSEYCYCIPYNEDTKHLIGITDDAPEYYKYWEE